MLLTLYGLDEKPVSCSWDVFCAAFAPLQIDEDPALGATHWVLKHEKLPIRFYAPITKTLGHSVDQVHFEFDDVAAFAEEGGCLNHPFWTGLFNLLHQWPCLLRVSSIPMGKTVVVASEEATKRFPSWVYPGELAFVASTRAEFDALIAEAWDLIGRINSGIEPRLNWADPIEHDAEALTAYSNFVEGKRGKIPRYTWVGKPIKIYGSRGNFLDRYGVWVDWRDFDDSVVNYFAERLREPSLHGEATDNGLRIAFGTAVKNLSLEHIGRERYQTIRGLNEVLAGAYEIRGVRKEMQDDTHCFLIAPVWLWQHLEAHDREKLDRKIKRIDEQDGFMPPDQRGLAP